MKIERHETGPRMSKAVIEWLTDRIGGVSPAAIVSILLCIKDIVEAAAISAGSDAPRYAVPFPGVGQPVRFLREMAETLPRLPRV